MSRVDPELSNMDHSAVDYATSVDATDSGPLSGPQNSTHSANSSRHAFFFKHTSDAKDPEVPSLLPLASQVPFLLEVYTERVHSIIGLPHMPSFKNLLPHRRSERIETSSFDENALIFAVFYAAICSMDEDEVSSSFNETKSELALKYQTGLETCLAKADFLNNPNDTNLQAFVIFLALARRDDSPKYIWMMTGLAIRIARYMGLHRDGAASCFIPPFQTEMRRRLWWDICILDVRAADDQGTELAIPYGSFSTGMASNLNDSDIWPGMEHSPSPREEVTNVTLLRHCAEVTRHAQELMMGGASATLEENNRRLQALEDRFDREYFNLTDPSRDPTYLSAAGFFRTATARLSLSAFLPILYASPSTDNYEGLRIAMLSRALEVIEHNHALNTDIRCQPWRWVYQTQRHWHAVIFLLIELCRRPWSATMERAWLALQSPWLIPARAPIDSNYSVLVPLRRLMSRVRGHRQNEIERLHNNPSEAAKVAEDDLRFPTPSSSVTFPSYFNDDTFRKFWWQLIQSATPIMAAPVADSATVNRRVEDENHASRSNQPPTSSHEVIEGTNWDAFLGMDSDIDLSDVMGDFDVLDYDWNRWLESSKGFL
jgi:hypothetical protein